MTDKAALLARMIARYTAARCEAYESALFHSKEASRCEAYGWFRDANTHRAALRSCAGRYRDSADAIAECRAAIDT